jgi:AraC-like DNA-binding protein
LRPASSASEFLAAPIGRYWLGRRCCVFAHSPTLLGFACWGRPDVEDVRELLGVCEFALEPELVPYRWLVDNRGLELVEPATFAQFIEYTRRNRDVLGQKIVRQAQLRPEGFVGAVLSGFSRVARLPYPERVFGDVEEAIGWLAVEREVGVDLLTELDTIRSQTSESNAVVARLRQELEGAGTVAIDEAARRLGRSTRSLQRALREAGTTYRVELEAFRVRRAQELLRRDERPLTWIAAEVGFSSAQHFATAYRRAVGETPSEWRMRHRP